MDGHSEDVIAIDVKVAHDIELWPSEQKAPIALDNNTKFLSRLCCNVSCGMLLIISVVFRSWAILVKLLSADLNKSHEARNGIDDSHGREQ